MDQNLGRTALSCRQGIWVEVEHGGDPPLCLLRSSPDPPGLSILVIKPLYSTSARLGHP